MRLKFLTIAAALHVVVEATPAPLQENLAAAAIGRCVAYCTAEGAVCS